MFNGEWDAGMKKEAREDTTTDGYIYCLKTLGVFMFGDLLHCFHSGALS
jgi:hypothetical protein